jgi:hypothetical protein
MSSVDIYDDLASFVCQYNENYTDWILADCLRRHESYGTLNFEIDEKGIKYVVRWNVLGDCADVLDFYIRPDSRNSGLIKEVLLKALRSWPNLKRMRFKRYTKYPGRDKRDYSIERILKGELHGRRHEH